MSNCRLVWCFNGFIVAPVLRIFYDTHTHGERKTIVGGPGAEPPARVQGAEPSVGLDDEVFVFKQ